eukprot:gnl/Chilomastix_cuspidata/3806.p1 GENE.gnl/Chilomastix_cuspidata/3806~~gnl/Chilomastix_cuspidata/3806.p1  ORF type:complete len:213 (+),score=59.85 gnl/Chilomastix_cuspidata/3806:590-1228(+)
MERVPGFDLFSTHGKMVARGGLFMFALAGFSFCFTPFIVFSRDPEKNWNIGFVLYGIVSGCVVFYSVLVYFLFRVLYGYSRALGPGCLAYTACSLTVTTLSMGVASLWHIDWVKGEVPVDRFYNAGWSLCGAAVALLVATSISLGAFLKRRHVANAFFTNLIQAGPSILAIAGFPVCMLVVGIIYESSPIRTAGSVILAFILVVMFKVCGKR